MTLSYLVSTAGHARAQNEAHPHDITSICQLILEGAEESDRPAVGFSIAVDGQDQAEVSGWRPQPYTFRQLLQLSRAFSELVKDAIPTEEDATPGQMTVSLLCPTGPEFLIAWIACMLHGWATVFIAPQCSPTAINHLGTSSESRVLFVHERYAKLADSAATNSKINLMKIPSLDAIEKRANELSTEHDVGKNAQDDDVSHVFHTSGTSGIPKLVPQTHLQSVSVLPRRSFPSDRDTLVSSFTTTPLFHGGVSDLLRGWMARSLVWLYPSSTSAITAASVTASMHACDPTLAGRIDGQELVLSSASAPPITAFLSVPYILALLAADKAATKMLSTMELVSTGGAPLETAIGDAMVAQGVRLVSRLGSSECGFLLSSYRDFDTEKDWEWMRNDSPYRNDLAFEPFEGDPRGLKAEMVVAKAWRSRTKSNRPDGSYATGDLYERHPTKKDTWKYAGRGDDTIVLSNGEKASPAAMEAILRSSPLVADALVVGVDKSQVGCLVFPAPNAPAPDLIPKLDKFIKQANSDAPAHAQLATEMCLVIADPERIEQLPKSSKGTIQRGVAYQVFSDEIDRLYAASGGAKEGLRLSEEEMTSWLSDLVDKVVGGSQLTSEKLSPDSDLFSWGVDSLKATRIRSAIIKNLDIGDRTPSPNVVFEHPTVRKLARHCVALRDAASDDAGFSNEQQLALMGELVTKYGTFTGARPIRKGHARTTVLLTGATGSLGAFLLAQLVARADVEHVFCIARAPDDCTATERIKRTLAVRELEAEPERLTVFRGSLGQPDLGLDERTLHLLEANVDLVIHCAWAVHFGSTLESFEADHIRGVRNLLDFATTAGANFVFCSSIASVLGRLDSNGIVSEQPCFDPKQASPIGYSRSKWVAERICEEAARVMSGRVKVLRIGQLCGDTKTGQWNEKEGWPLLIRTAAKVGCLPLLEEDVSWLPVDVASKAVIELANQRTETEGSESLPIYHVAHPTEVSWRDVLAHLKKAGLHFDTVDPDTWLKKVAGLPEDDPSQQMLSMWTSAYSSKNGEKAIAPRIQTEQAQRLSPSLREATPISSELLSRTLAAWRLTGFINA